jgi:hypothetical protein
MSAEERRIRQADRLASIRLRIAIGRELDERDITTPVAIGEALGMPPAEAVKLMTRHQWREGDVARLAATGAGCTRRHRGLGLAVVSAGPGALPDASTRQNHLGTTVATAAPPTVSYLATKKGGCGKAPARCLTRVQYIQSWP